MSNSNKLPKRPSFFWPLFLIGIGVTFLLSNLGILPNFSVNLLVKFWPLILVVIGLDLLFGRRSAIGPIITSIFAILLLGGIVAFLVFAPNISDITKYVDLGEFKHAQIREPLQNAESASVFIDWTSSPARLYALSDSNNLIDGNINYYGNLYFDVQRDGNRADVSVDTRIEEFFISTINFNNQASGWDIGLHPDVTLDLALDAGSGPGNYDLQDLNLNKLNIDAGSGPLSITLPNSGQADGFIDGGSGPITLILPDGMEAKLIVDEGSGPFFPGSRLSPSQSESRDSDVSVWLTDGFRGADNYIELEIVQGSGPIKVE